MRLISDSYVGIDIYDGRKHDADCGVYRVECDGDRLNRASFYECDHQNYGLQTLPGLKRVRNVRKMCGVYALCKYWHHIVSIMCRESLNQAIFI